MNVQVERVTFVHVHASRQHVHFFMAFMAFIAFMAAFFFITFMAFMALGSATAGAFFMAAFFFITFIAFMALGSATPEPSSWPPSSSSHSLPSWPWAQQLPEPM